YLFTMHLSYNACFQLYCKDKAFDAWDQCLTDGRMLFAESGQYAEFLTSVSPDN
ncbi:hypothetical protein FRC12_021361, partial [Ceratobasidium sp. 428]